LRFDQWPIWATGQNAEKQKWQAIGYSVR